MKKGSQTLSIEVLWNFDDSPTKADFFFPTGSKKSKLSSDSNESNKTKYVDSKLKKIRSEKFAVCYYFIMVVYRVLIVALFKVEF